MKKICILICLYSIVLLLNSCKVKNDLQSLQLFKQLENVKENDLIYVIPGSGCTGCISEIEAVALNNYKNENKYFLFTNIKSFKLFKNRFGQDFISHKNVILDTANLFKFPKNYSSIYPLLLIKMSSVIRAEKSFKP